MTTKGFIQWINSWRLLTLFEKLTGLLTHHHRVRPCKKEVQKQLYNGSFFSVVHNNHEIIFATGVIFRIVLYPIVSFEDFLVEVIGVWSGGSRSEESFFTTFLFTIRQSCEANGKKNEK